MADMKSNELTIWIKNDDQEQKNTEIIQRNSFCDVLCSPLVFVKSSFFFWFMGGSEVMAFSSLFFKQQGLTIKHISLITSISGVFEVIMSLLTGVILDRFGRAKLILLSNIGVTILVSLSLVILPSIENCNETEFLLHCNNTVSVKMGYPELCNSTTENTVSLENCSSFDLVHLSPGQGSYNCSGDVKLVVSPEEFSAEETSLNLTHKIRLVEPRRVIECYLNDSGIRESNCLQSVDQCSKTNSDNTLLLVLYGLLICLFHTSRSTTYRFFDFIGVSLSAKHGVDFGRQRMCGVFGNLFGASSVGYIIRSLNTEEGHQHQQYFVAFLAYMLLAFLSGLSICNVDCRVKPRSEKVSKEFLSLLKKPDMIMYLIVLFVVGTSFVFNAIYLGLFQEELGSSALVIGLTSTVMSACGLPFLFTARWWIRKLGNRTIFSLALFLAAFFHTSVSFVETSLPIMFLVLVNIFTYHLMWVETMNFARTIAPEKVSGTVIFTAGCVFYVITKASASLIGGMVMSAYGARTANRVIGAMCLLTGVFYLLCTCCSSKKEEPQEPSKPCDEDSKRFL